MSWETVIGLEIHAHLKTRTKMFCRCETGFGEPQNTRTCPVCLAHPGTLPVANRVAVEWTIKLGLALGCGIAPHAVLHRKNYFYPDLPKGYQISQYDEPLCVDGRFVVPGEEELEIGIIRAHLEEDAAKTVHLEGAGGRIVGATRSLVDFNRGGTPLVEIVTQPDLRSAEQARRFLQLLRQTIVELGISDAEMEKGTLRCDANVSVRRPGEGYRTRWELKNMNSFSFIARGIEAAVKAQVALHEAGAEVVQETYDYHADTDTLTPHRSKEEAEDYRYFPEPDLVPIEPEAALVERLRGELPELPGERIRRHAGELGTADAWALVTTDREERYAGLLAANLAPRDAFNRVMNEAIPSGANLSELAKIFHASGDLTREAVQGAVAASASPGFTADEYLAQKAVSDTAELGPLVDRIIEANPGQVAAYRGGKEGLLGYFVGQAMKETGGKADPKVLNELIREKLSA